MMPIHRTTRPHTGMVARQLQCGMSVEQRGKDLTCVLVMDPFGIGFGIAIAHELLYNFEAIGCLHGGHLGKTFAAFVLKFLPEQISEVFGAVNFFILTDNLLIPNCARGEESFVLDGIEILSTGEV